MGVRKVITCDLCGTEDVGEYLVINAKWFAKFTLYIMKKFRRLRENLGLLFFYI